ncbi:hypothetical protein FC093_17020 [Ilyomonas limi]|uniref:Uncharacterized protein n=1 Tax=Ilyomonas limi TaxID=2575867 RepID=A0A4U3KYT4_9BACT|nr:hypothetical protein [Ilyomonas limi]TKK66287.1 hypothetical protein FC093_17020 [Ilyomonas limi]
MKKNSSIQLKAVFLLTVFALNMVVGFACAIGIDMGFNSHHHQDDESIQTTEHVHADGSKHLHHNQPVSHHHDEANNQTSKDDNNCCKDKVTKLAQLDKSVPQAYSGIHPVFFTALVSTFYNIEILPSTGITNDIKQFVRSYHPPIPDIRIAIQSFQI